MVFQSEGYKNVLITSQKEQDNPFESNKRQRMDNAETSAKLDTHETRLTGLKSAPMLYKLNTHVH